MRAPRAEAAIQATDNNDVNKKGHGSVRVPPTMRCCKRRRGHSELHFLKPQEIGVVDEIF